MKEGKAVDHVKVRGMNCGCIFVRVVLAGVLALHLLSACEEAATILQDGDDLRDEPNVGITVIANGPLITSESGTAASFSVRLQSEPTMDVIVPIACESPTEGTIDHTELHFGPQNWHQALLVTVTGVDDLDFDGDQSYTISLLPAISDDERYDGIDPDDLTIVNTDNETFEIVADQVQTETASVGMLVGGSSEQKLAQTVTVGISGDLVAIGIPVGTCSGTLVLEIQGVSGGYPDGIALSSANYTFDNYPLPESDGLRVFDLATPLSLAGGDQIAFVISCPDGQAVITRAADGDQYSGGRGYFDSRPNPEGVWIPLTGAADLSFVTYVSSYVGRGVVTFAASGVSVSEDAAVANVVVERLLGSDGPASVHYSVVRGSAEAGADFTEVNGTLEWAHGDASERIISIPILDDANVEPEEVFQCVLSGPSDMLVLKYPNSLSVTIQDDDVNEVIDQEQPEIDKSVGGSMIGGQSDQKLAQVVTVGQSGMLMAVKLPVGGSTGGLIVEIQGVSAGKPNGVVLQSETFSAPGFPAEDADGMRRFEFSSPDTHSAGDRIAIVLSAPGGSYGIFRGPIGDPYEGGNGYYRYDTISTWVPLSSRLDLPFKTLVHVP